MITYTHGGVTRCLGYLMDFKDKGVFDANFGKVDISPEHAKTHNEELDKALLIGLDKCEIGQWGSFYVSEKPKEPVAVKTFLGTVVSTDVSLYKGGKAKKTLQVTFRRNGRTYRGNWKRLESDLFDFKRIA